MKFELIKHNYSADDKLKWWGYGEWVEEPDYVEFEHEGIKCRVLRIVKLDKNGFHFGGYWCGYVQTPKNSIICSLDPFELTLESYPHGGITYGNNENDGYWLGFDCAHSGDIIPSMHFLCKTHPEFSEIKKHKDELIKRFPTVNASIFEEHYRNFDFAVEQTKILVDEVKKFRNSEKV